METALTQKFPFILDRNLAKANCTKNGVCTSCDTVVLASDTRPINMNLKAELNIKKEYLQLYKNLIEF